MKKLLFLVIWAIYAFSIQIDDLTFLTDPEKPQLSQGEAAVFPYADEAIILLEKASEIKRARGKEFDFVVDPFCGDGKSGLPMVYHSIAKRLVASDINPRAIHYAEENAKRNHLEGKSQFSVRDILKDGLAESAGNTLWIANPPFSLKVKGADLALMRDGGENGLVLTLAFVKQALKVAKAGDVILGIGYSRIRPDGSLELYEELSKLTGPYGATFAIFLLHGQKLWRGFNGRKEQENPMPITPEVFAVRANPDRSDEVLAHQEAAHFHNKAGYDRIGYYYYMIEK